MGANKSIWPVTAIALLTVTSGVLLAQKADAPQHDVLVQAWSSGDRAWLGVRLSDIKSDQLSQFKLSGTGGALITEVEKDSPAGKAGLAVNDVVIEFDGERVRGVAELRRLVHETPVGRTISVEISRDGHRQKFNLTVEPRPESHAWVMPPMEMHMPDVHVPDIKISPFEFDFHSGPSRLGITGDDLTPQLAKYFGVSEGKGVLVTSVIKGSPAEKAGLQAGDCIVRVDTTPVGSVWELRRALSEDSRNKREVNLAVVREHAQQQLKVELEAEWHEPSLSADEDDELREFGQGLKDLGPEMEQFKEEIDQHRGEIEELQRQYAGDAAQQAAAQLRRNAEAIRRAMLEQRYSMERQKRILRDQQRQMQDQLRNQLRSIENGRAIV